MFLMAAVYHPQSDGGQRGFSLLGVPGGGTPVVLPIRTQCTFVTWLVRIVLREIGRPRAQNFSLCI